ncbi:MAG: isoprenylcysteine carboxylmethyltransferase family protein [Proteobacteria bacterium]|nr:isoprenylcysteine carboxylmethyltransferase family protein [Pseudomonadota bacterium]
MFTLLVPGTVVGLVPTLLLGDAPLDALNVFVIYFLGVIPIVLGLALYLRCAYDFALSGRGTPAPIDPPDKLVIKGPYRYSRNPMYLGILAILGGEALLFQALPLLYFLLVMAAAFQIFIVGYEERALGRKFGQAYTRYCEEVPRWIPAGASLKALYKGTFLKVGAFVYLGGVIIHVLRLTVEVPVTQMPVSAHAILVVLPAYVVFGSIIYWRQIDLTGLFQKVTFALATGLLLITAVMHAYSIIAQTSAWLGIFPIWYSVLAAVVYGGFGYFLKTRKFKK